MYTAYHTYVYTLREFRAKTKEAFDRAASGETVEIDRNGAVYTLLLKEPTIKMQLPKIIKEPVDFKPQLVDPAFKPCRHNADPKFCRHAKPGKPCK